MTEIPGSEDTVIMEDDGTGDIVIQEESEELNDTVNSDNVENSDNTQNTAGTGEEILDENGYTEEVVPDADTEEVVAENTDQDLEAEVGLESLTTDTESEE